jgi:hypothetical protein
MAPCSLLILYQTAVWHLDAARGPSTPSFEIEVSYEDVAGNPYNGRFKIDVGQFDGLHRLGQPTDEQIAESLKKIVSVMERWGHQRLQVETMSVTERREHDEQVRKLMEERKAKRDPPKDDDTEAPER